MIRYLHSRLLALAIILVTMSYGALVFFPAIMDNHIVGFVGKLTNGSYQVYRVFPESPAAIAGLHVGDQVIRIEDQSITDLSAMHKRDFSRFVSTTSHWMDQSLQILVTRDGEQVELVVSPAPLSVQHAVWLFGPRVLFCLFLLLMIVIIGVSGTRSREAKIFLACYFFAILWLLIGTRHWPSFGLLLIPNTESDLFRFQAAASIVSLQMSAGMLLLVAFRFPRKLAIINRIPAIQLLMAFVPLALVLLGSIPGSDSFYGFGQAGYGSRIWINTVALLGTLGLFILNYRACESSLHQVQSRWIIASFAIASALIIGLWNLPLLISGSALFGNFDWLLIPIGLLPLSMTLAINNHRLFGIHGIVGYRLRILQSRLDREKKHVHHRDKRISALYGELEKLRSELDDYTEHKIRAGSSRGSSRLMDLENRFPRLRDIRRERLLGASPVWEGVFEEVIMASYGSTPVMIFGESGTGKTDIALSVHQLSNRHDKTYREVSCAQFEHADPAIALGRLFGIAPGHGLANVPQQGQSGLLEECDGGTLFMDDFDCLPGNVQNLMLYPLEGKPFDPGIGRGASRQVSVKFILATNRNPELLVSQGKLRGDILARLENRINIPPLRERREDIPLLVSHFLDRLTREIDVRGVDGEEMGISEKAMEVLCEQDYRDGNARQLQSMLRYAVGKVVLERDTLVRATYLQDRVLKHSDKNVATRPDPAENTEQDQYSVSSPTCISGENHELEVLRRHSFQIAPSEKELGLSLKSRTLSNHLRGLCIQALNDHDWNVHEAALYVVGNSDHRLVRKLEGKIARYLKNIQLRARDGSELKLYNNLPARYHDALAASISKFRDA